jgi:hypothetical protein
MRSIGNIWIKRRLLLGRSRNTWLITKFALALGILMTAARLQLGYKYATPVILTTEEEIRRLDASALG